jgi:hypothetical protein
MATMADLFEPEPGRWGLRGDPHLWRALRDYVGDQDIPASAAGVTGLPAPTATGDRAAVACQGAGARFTAWTCSDR